MALVVLTVATVGRLLTPRTYKVQSYNGVTWVDDVCHVDEEGVLWCTPRA
jgi:hypothetical protein